MKMNRSAGRARKRETHVMEQEETMQLLYSRIFIDVAHQKRSESKQKKRERSGSEMEAEGLRGANIDYVSPS